jgi:ubiquinone/menaquinone biosynthesis C-methylase UbiE
VYIETAEIYRSPKNNQRLRLEVEEENNNRVKTGKLVAEDGESFLIKNGIVDFTWPKELAKIDKETRAIYDKLASEYEKFAPIPFLTYKCDERVIRKNITERLCINRSSKVLEIGCGCGDGSVYIAEQLGEKGCLFLQDLSPAFLAKAVEKTKGFNVPIEYAIANGCSLSFPDNYFDAAHHFGGLNTFSDIKKCLGEMARVVRPGGKVVVGDEGIGAWLRETQFAKIMMNSNPLLKYLPPVEQLPTMARGVKVEWIMMDAFYLIEFTVAADEPVADYHVPIPSDRGGTHWTRFYGNLEGVSDEAKKMALISARESGKSMSQWLDDAVRYFAQTQSM